MSDLSVSVSRRGFIKSAAVVSSAVLSSNSPADAAAAAVPQGAAFADGDESSVQNGWPIAIFEKPFEGLTYEELAASIQQIGADGVEATIRPGGHIEPAKAADEVPRMADALSRHGKRILIAATGIGVAGRDAEAQLRVLKECGVTHYRMAHYRFSMSEPLLPQLRSFSSQAKELAALNREIGIQGLYQNHSQGRSRQGYLGALGWDAAMMLEGTDPSDLGLALDTRHLRKDTGSSWTTALRLLKPHIRSVYVKDGVWGGDRGDEYRDVPLDEGFVNRELFSQIREGLSPMPLCIHMEWLGYRVFPKEEIPDAVDACRRDLKVLRSWLQS